MDALTFEIARQTLSDLQAAEVDDLSAGNEDIREDGLPQNWVDDLPNLTAEQRAALAAVIPEDAVGWPVALRAVLLE